MRKSEHDGEFRDQPCRSGILSEMRQPEVEAFNPEIVMLGIGSTEPHGPALPYGTDVYRCETLCRRATEIANRRGARVLLFPVLPIANNVNFGTLPFALRIGVRTLMQVLLDIFESIEAEGVRKIVLVNTHGGNGDTIKATLREHYGSTPPERRAFVCLAGAMPGDDVNGLLTHPSPHAGEGETSAILHTHPALVDERELDQALPISEVMDGLVHLDRTTFVRAWDYFLPRGGGGILNESSGEKGGKLLESGASGFADFLVSLSAASWHPGFPYAPDAKESVNRNRAVIGGR